jgi:hypothetical protein
MEKLLYPAKSYGIHLLEAFAEGGAKSPVGRVEGDADILENPNFFRTGIVARSQEIVSDSSSESTALLPQIHVLLLGVDS